MAPRKPSTAVLSKYLFIYTEYSNIIFVHVEYEVIDVAKYIALYTCVLYTPPHLALDDMLAGYHDAAETFSVAAEKRSGRVVVF